MKSLKEIWAEIVEDWNKYIVEPNAHFQEVNAALMAEFYKERNALPEGQRADIYRAASGMATSTELDETNKAWIAQTRKVLTDTKAPKSMLDAFDSIMEAKWPMNIIGAFGIWLLWELTRCGSVGRILGIEAAFSAAREVRPTRPDPSTLWRMAFTDKADRDKAISALKDLGYSDDFIAGLERANRIYTDATTAMSLWRRGDLSETGFYDRLAKLGFDPQTMVDLAKLKDIIPGPGDLVTFALREVWRSDLRPELLSPDAPGRYYELMAKQGYSRSFAEDYWASHWVLPSVRQGFEMFWRIPGFTESDLRALLVRLDILPRYHDNLMAIAYAPWTRVDIRRMHKLGVIPDRAGLERAYGDIGYHGRQLEGIVDFTIAYNAEEERDYTRTDILAAYEIGRFSRSEALGALISIGYSETLADVWLSKSDLARANKYARERITQVKTLYRGKRLTRTEAHTQLTNIPIPSTEADTYLELWDVGREALVGRPSKSELRRFFLQNILEEAEFRTELAGHHLSATYVDWYVDDAKLDLAAAMMKEVERTQKEEQRVRKSKVTSDRDKALAKLDVLIAEANVSIADIKLSMIVEMPEEEIDQAKKLILAFKAAIAELRERKALVRVGYYEEIQPGE